MPILTEQEDGKGFDAVGNIFIEENDYAVLRGGWTDTAGVVYEDSFNPKNGKNYS